MDDFDPEQLKEFEENLRSMNASMGSTTNALENLAAQLSKLADQQIESSQKLSKGMADLSNQVGQETEAKKAKTEADNQVKIAAEALERSFKSASSAVTDFSAQILSGKEGFSKYGSALSGLGDSTVELTSTMGPLAKGIGIAIDLFTKLAAVMMAQTDMQNQFVKDMNRMGVIAGTTSDELTDLARDAGYAATDLEKLTPIVQSVGEGLATFGTGTTQGTKALLEMFKMVDSQEADMRRYGYTLEEAQEQMGFYVNLQRQSGIILKSKDVDEIKMRKLTMDYAKSLVTLSELTGKQAEQMKQEQLQVQMEMQNQISNVARQSELNDLREQIDQETNSARKAELTARHKQLQDEEDTRAAAMNRFSTTLGPQFNTQLQRVLRTGAFDESTKALSMMGFQAGELKKQFENVKVDTPEYDALMDSIEQQFRDGVLGQIETFGGAAQYMGTEAEAFLASVGVSREALQAMLAIEEDRAGQVADANKKILDSTAEGADGQKDTAAALQVFERNVRTGADEFLDSINIFNTSLNAQILAMGALTAAATLAALSLGRMSMMGGPGTLKKLFGMGGQSGTRMNAAGRMIDSKTGRFVKTPQPGMMSKIGTGLSKTARVGGGLVAGAVAVGSAAYERQGAINEIDRNFFEKTQGMDKDSSQYQRAKDEADIERKGANRKAVGQGAGGLGGAAAGAAAGAAIGSFVPIIGTAIGGLIGAGLGAWMGSELGSTIGEALSPEEMKAYEASEKEIALMSTEEREAWQKQYDQAQQAIDIAEKELEETRIANAENLRLAQDAELYDKDLIGASEINWQKLGELKDGTDEQKEQLKGMLAAILDDNDLREGDRITIEEQLKLLEGVEENTSPEEETEEKSFATMTQAELYAHFEKVRAGEQPDIADDKNVIGTDNAEGDQGSVGPDGIVTLAGEDDAVDDAVVADTVDISDESQDDKKSFAEKFADANQSLLGFLRNPLDTIRDAGSPAMAGTDATYTQEDIDALPEDQQDLVQVGDKIQDEADSWGKLGSDLLNAFNNSPLVLAYQSIDGMMNSVAELAGEKDEQLTKMVDATTEKIKVDAEVEATTTEVAQTVDGETQGETEYKETLDIQKQQLAETRKQNELLERGLAQGSEQVEELNKIVTRAAV